MVECGYASIKGEIGYISTFRFYWFEPICFYNLQSSFAKDKMESGFFLHLADYTGDNFSYFYYLLNTGMKYQLTATLQPYYTVWYIVDLLNLLIHLYV